jgi:hypothetical protein
MTGGLLLSIVSPPDEALAKQHGVTARFERGNGIWSITISIAGPATARSLLSVMLAAKL